MNAWLFDVDGVITNPIEKRVTHPEIIDELIRRLKKAEPIGLNTGRSIDFIVEQILVPLEQHIEDKSLLRNVFAIGEMGGVRITYQDGQRQENVDGEISVPQNLQDKVRSLVKLDFSDIMFYDETKKTMITVELKLGKSLDEFHLRQTEFVGILRDLLQKHHFTDIRVDATTIATDIENSHVGKALGVKRFLKLLSERKVNTSNFIVFGDSKSDLEMGEELHIQGKKFTFVYVGEGEIKQTPFEVIRTTKHYDQGTLEYLISA